jgi:hypothetical protein
VSDSLKPFEVVATVAHDRIVAVEPTQMRRPWQATIRTTFQALVALATLLPLVVANVYDSPDAYPAVVAQVLVVAGIVARLMAHPGVEAFLREFFPFLAAAPPPRPRDEPGVTTSEVCLIVIAGVAAVWFIAWLTGDFNPGGR